MSFLFLLNSLTASGGSEKKTVRVVNELTRRGYGGHLGVLNGPDDLRTEIEDRVRLIELDRSGKIDRSVIKRLLEYIKENNITGIMCINLYPVIYGFALQAILPSSNFRCAALLNMSNFDNMRDRLKMLMYRPLLGRVSRLVFGCKAQQEDWVSRYRFKSSKCSFIYNGVDCQQFDQETMGDAGANLRRELGLTSTDFVIINVGQFRPEKKQEYIISACSILVRKGYPVHLLLVGDGPRRADLLSHVNSTEMAGRVHFLGQRYDVRPALSAADLFVLSSVAVETFSNSALEAMAMGLPVILSDVGGAQEMVVDGYNGYLYPAADVAALVEKIGLFLENSATCKTMGTQARKMVLEKFAFATMVDEYEKLISVLC